MQLEQDLQVYYAAEQVYLLQQKHRWYILAVYYPSRRLDYIPIPPAVGSQYLLVHVDQVMPMYIGHCSSRHWNMSMFDVNDQLEATTDDYADNANKYHG